jgi:hypothetical protein
VLAYGRPATVTRMPARLDALQPTRGALVIPKIGDVVALGGRASVQFAGDRDILLRVTVIDRRPTYHGWVWLTGYVLDRTGQAIDKREVFVQLAGLSPARVHSPPATPAASMKAARRQRV